MATQEEVEKILEGIDFKNLTADQITGKHELALGIDILTSRF